jgi:hypothetical protein
VYAALFVVVVGVLAAWRYRTSRGAPRAEASALLLATGAILAQDLETLLRNMQDFNAVQVVYRGGVPHTDKNGNLLTRYDPQRSFFQIGIWGNPYGEIYGTSYDLKTLTEAGFNTMWPWPIGTFEQQLESGMIMAGTPKQVLPRIRHLLEETRPGIMAVWAQDGKVSQKDSLRCIELLGTEVFPQVREWAKELGLNSPFEADAPVHLKYSTDLKKGAVAAE